LEGNITVKMMIGTSQAMIGNSQAGRMILIMYKKTIGDKKTVGMILMMNKKIIGDRETVGIILNLNIEIIGDKEADGMIIDPIIRKAKTVMKIMLIFNKKALKTIFNVKSKEIVNMASIQETEIIPIQLVIVYGQETTNGSNFRMVSLFFFSSSLFEEQNADVASIVLVFELIFDIFCENIMTMWIS